MILSEKFRFVFVKGMKVAGTSVEMALSTICGPNDIVTPISPIDEIQRMKAGGHCRNYSDDPAGEAAYLARLRAARPDDVGKIAMTETKYFNHMALSQIAQRYPGSLDGFKIVVVERSPYAKILSLVNMRLTYHLYKDDGAEMRADPAALRQRLGLAIENGGILSVRNIDRYAGADGKFAGYVMRYENLAKDFGAFLKSIGVETPIPLPHAKKGMMADSVDPRDFLQPDQIAKINQIFTEEFRIFGYPML